MSPSGASPRILIAGGGIAGLALARALSLRGIASQILERRAQFSEAGAGIQIGPNGVRVLQALGCFDALEPLTGRPTEIRVRAGATGRLLQRLPLGDWIGVRHGAPYIVALRRDLQTALIDALRGDKHSGNAPVEIVTGSQISDFDINQTEDQPPSVAVLVGATRVQGSVLVGADGVHSTVRQRLFPGTEPRFAGRIAARTVISADQGCDLPTDATVVWLAPQSHVVHYPVRQGREIAVVVVTTEATWQSEGWSEDVASDVMDRALRGFAPELRNALLGASDWRRWALFAAAPLPRWSRGNVTLIGDAAHPTLPFLAQGGCLALEDAVVLAQAISATPANLEVAFRVYEDARRRRANRVAATAKRNGQIYHLDGFAARARDFALGLIPPERVMASYDWVYGWRPPVLKRPRT